MTRRLVVDPDPRLRKMCADVLKIDDKILRLANELLAYIRRANKTIVVGGVKPMGLAAPQLGELVRLFIIDTPNFSLTMANPRLVKTVGTHNLYEQCLSLPGREFIVARPKIVKIRGLGLDGVERTVKVHGELAQAVMHEMDHLGGILIDNRALKEVFSRSLHA